jgi:hypothetical protein
MVAWLQTVLLAGICVLLTLDLLGAPQDPLPSPAAPREVQADPRLVEILRGLRSAVDTLSERLRSGVPGLPERQSIGEVTELTKLTEQLARLEHALRREPGAAASVRAPDGNRQPAWDRIEPLIKARDALEGAERAAFLRTFLLLDESEVLARHGVPTEILVDGSGVERWHYNDPEKNMHLAFLIHRGRVIAVW